MWTLHRDRENPGNATAVQDADPSLSCDPATLEQKNGGAVNQLKSKKASAGCGIYT